MRITLRQWCCFYDVQTFLDFGPEVSFRIAYAPVEQLIGRIQAEIELCRLQVGQDFRVGGIADQKGGHSSFRDQIDELF